MLDRASDEVNSMAKDQRMWSKKMDQQKGKAVRLTKNLGSTKHYMGDIGESQSQRVFVDKVQYINEDEERELKASKDKATIKYNH